MPDSGFLPDIEDETATRPGRNAGLTAGQFLLIGAAVAGAGLALLATSAADAARAAELAGPELTRLLRAMAGMKLAFGAGLFAAAYWRLATPAPLWRLAGYAGAVAAMAAGPVLIWGMLHVVIGAALLHGGLLAGVLLLWRDEAVATRLARLVQRRRETLRAPH